MASFLTNPSSGPSCMDSPPSLGTAGAQGWSRGSVHASFLLNKITDISENIAFPRTAYMVGNKRSVYNSAQFLTLQVN